MIRRAWNWLWAIDLICVVFEHDPVAFTMNGQWVARCRRCKTTWQGPS